MKKKRLVGKVIYHVLVCGHGYHHDLSSDLDGHELL